MPVSPWLWQTPDQSVCKLESLGCSLESSVKFETQSESVTKQIHHWKCSAISVSIHYHRNRPYAYT